MNTKTVMLGAAIVAASLVAGVFIQKRQSACEPSPFRNAKRVDKSATSPNENSPIKPRAAAVVAEMPSVPQAQPNPSAAAPQQQSTTNPPGKEPLHDPIARDALALVGFDPEAEVYWFEAINDMSLPANERQDLIEDLNEEGLPDPKHPTPDDLPLILNRLALIEAVGPDAVDKVNADAFEEAYKDLLNLAELAMGGGEPVK